MYKGINEQMSKNKKCLRFIQKKKKNVYYREQIIVQTLSHLVSFVAISNNFYPFIFLRQKIVPDCLINKDKVFIKF